MLLQSNTPKGKQIVGCAALSCAPNHAWHHDKLSSIKLQSPLSGDQGNAATKQYSQREADSRARSAFLRAKPCLTPRQTERYKTAKSPFRGSGQCCCKATLPNGNDGSKRHLAQAGPIFSYGHY